jgi:hypothetical protein
MNLNVDTIAIAYEYVAMTEVRPQSFEQGDVMGMLNFTRDVTITFTNFIQACDDDHILVDYYRQLVTCLKKEEYIEAEGYKQLIINYEP